MSRSVRYFLGRPICDFFFPLKPHTIFRVGRVQLESGFLSIARIIDYARFAMLACKVERDGEGMRKGSVKQERSTGVFSFLMLLF